jgi:hypothetical protein
LRLRYGSSIWCASNCLPERAMVSLRHECLHAVRKKAAPSAYIRQIKAPSYRPEGEQLGDRSKARVAGRGGREIRWKEGAAAVLPCGHPCPGTVQ